MSKVLLLICTIDLPGLEEHPEARQLLACLQSHAASDDFKPRQELSADQVEGILGQDHPCTGGSPSFMLPVR